MDAQHDLAVLEKAYPDAKYYLSFDTPFHLMLATILSAQCTDVVVNKTTPALYAAYKTPSDVLKSPPGELEGMIKSITFANAKASHIRKACETLVKDFGSEVPRGMEQLLTLTGVGRKTANALQQNAFDTVNGVIVDTHVIRIALRLGWTRQKDPEKIERDLIAIFPKAKWKRLPHLLKAHGQRVCTAPRPKCNICPLKDTCPSSEV